MPQGDWQFETAYEDKYALDAPGFAFEYLRRNRSFIRDCRRLESLLKRGTLSQKTRDAYARRWGMRFREIYPGGRISDDPVDNDGSPGCDPIDARIDGLRSLSDASSQIPAPLDRRANR
jgi:hypothetical protein